MCYKVNAVVHAPTIQYIDIIIIMHCMYYYWCGVKCISYL